MTIERHKMLDKYPRLLIDRKAIRNNTKKLHLGAMSRGYL